MLEKIDKTKLNQLKKENPDFAEIIDQMLLNHERIIGTISHEIRNPLALISSSLQLLACNYPNVVDYSHWHSTITEVDYMKFLMDDLLSLNKATRANCVQIDMHKFSHQVVSSFIPSLKDTNITFTSSIPTLVPFVYGDALKLHEVFINLLRNAKESISDIGKIHLSVSQETISSTIYLVATITDTGCGIPPEKIDTIFDTFVTTKSNGTGLGLSISRNIIENHMGSLNVQSAIGIGSTFIIHLPIHCY